MEKQMLRCDICGGELEMQGGGRAVCTSCGMKYSTESLREKFQGLKVSVTGSQDDVSQWKALVKTYMAQNDFPAAEGIVKKILEAVPSDVFANNMYSQLQEWKYLKIVNKILVGYSGRAHDIILPEGIQTIGKYALKYSEIHSITLPDTLVSIEEHAFEGCPNLQSIDLSNVENCGSDCFSYCRALSHVVFPRDMTKIPRVMFAYTALSEIDIPAKVKTIGDCAFQSCRSLKKVRLPDGLECIDSYAFADCVALEEISIPSTVKEIGRGAFDDCRSLTKIDISPTLLDKIYYDYFTRLTRDSDDMLAGPFKEVPWWNDYVDKRLRGENRCRYCGGEFKGMLKKVCTRCGRAKDY